MFCRKGQLFSFDGFLAIVVLLSFLSMYFLTFNANVFSLVGQLQSREMEFRADSFIGSLVRTPGDPPDWTSRDIDDIHHAGLSRGHNVVSVERILALRTYSINDLRRVTRFPFPFRLTVLDINGATFTYAGIGLELGDTIPSAIPELVVVRAPVLLVSDGGTVGHGIIRLVVWRQ